MHQNFYKLMNRLSKPSKVASTLDWKKMNGSTVLSLNIHRNRVGIAVGSHPSFGEDCIELEPLRFADDHINIDKPCLERFQTIIEDYKVCGIVVSWPLQHDTGRMGAACGRVMYTLEEIIDKSGESDSVLSKNRPLCLWDSEHIVPKQKEDPKKRVDMYGRCASYATTSEKEEYKASENQYHEDENTVVVQVWEDFCKEHWPELFSARHQEDDDFDDFGDFLQPTKKKTTKSSTRSTTYGTWAIKNMNEDHLERERRQLMERLQSLGFSKQETIGKETEPCANVGIVSATY